MQPVYEADGVQVIYVGDREIGAGPAPRKGVNVLHVIDVVAICSDPGYARDGVLFSRVRMIQPVGIGLCHSIQKGGVLANCRFVFGDAVDVGNGTAHWGC